MTKFVEYYNHDWAVGACEQLASHELAFQFWPGKKLLIIVDDVDMLQLGGEQGKDWDWKIGDVEIEGAKPDYLT